MSSTLCTDELAGHILNELRNAPENSRVGEPLLNAVVDAMVQANIDLDSVSLRDVKNLLSLVCRYHRDRIAEVACTAAF